MAVVSKILTGLEQPGVKKFKDYKRWVAHVLKEKYGTGAIADWNTAGDPVNAAINHTRWIVQCPDCPTALPADPTTPLFYCTHCQNIMNAGKARAVVFPENRADIERLLCLRPMPENRNWETGDTLEEIIALNSERGITEV